jgi:hypothetical protein
MHEKGYGVHLIPKRYMVPSEALSRREEQRTGLLWRDDTTNRHEYKGYKKILQGKVFHGSIANIHVTLIE